MPDEVNGVEWCSSHLMTNKLKSYSGLIGFTWGTSSKYFLKDLFNFRPIFLHPLGWELLELLMRALMAFWVQIRPHLAAQRGGHSAKGRAQIHQNSEIPEDKDTRMREYIFQIDRPVRMCLFWWIYSKCSGAWTVLNRPAGNLCFVMNYRGPDSASWKRRSGAFTGSAQRAHKPDRSSHLPCCCSLHGKPVWNCRN